MKNHILFQKNQVKVKFVIFVLGLFLFSFQANAQNMIHGFKLIEKRFIKEVNADCFYYEHVKSGAKLLKVAANDDNKTFAITFKTLPQTDNGIAHILEHSVLNGSKNFPAKSPFDLLSKGSLNTFLNALTSRDATSYPFASMNEKDYFNLMHVYLDAVFYPNLYTDTKILKQEGWHYELESPNDPITIKGVVYNEMKGAFSNPQREHFYQILKSLFPDNIYGNESGGLPNAITTLTQKEFVDFHKEYYHPSNSYIFLYGDGDINKELEFIDTKYLSHFTVSDKKHEIIEQKPFKEINKVTAYYPVMEGAPTDKQTFLSYNVVAGKSMDYAERMSLNMLAEVLVNQESAPIRLALSKAGIGQDVSATVLEYQQNGFAILVQNANPSDKEKFYEVVTNTLKDIIKNGIDKKELTGILNRYEFYYREGSDAQKGITNLNRIKVGWFFANNPFMGLEYEKILASLKEGINNKYYEGLIEKYLINNPHSSLISLEPKAGLDKERNEQLEKELKAYKDKLTPAQIDALVKETKELIEYQKTEDTPEAIATIPMLSLKDLNPKAAFFPCTPLKFDGKNVLHYNEFTNGIIYSNLLFDLRVLPQELLPYASLLSNIALSLNMQKRGFGEFNQDLNINTGSFYTSITSYNKDLDDNQLLPYFVVSAKVMKDNTTTLFTLTQELLNELKLNDKERLKEVIERHKSQVESSLNRDGYGVAYARLLSYVSTKGIFDELTDGIDYFAFLNQITKDFDTKSEEVISNLQKVSTLLFTQSNISANVTCGKEEITLFTDALSKFSKTLSTKSNPLQTWNLKPEIKNEGILTASKVQYVFMAANVKNLGYTWNGNMRVLNQILSTDYLYNKIRVIGGAYGGRSSVSPDGMFLMSSYRDPNLKNTIDVYKKAGEYLAQFEADETAMTRYIIGTISELDAPMTTQSKGNTAFRAYISGRTAEMIQKERDAILSTKPADIKSYEKMLNDVVKQNMICVYGNTDKIQAEKDLFKTLIKIKND